MRILHLIPYFIRADKTGGPALQLSRLANAEHILGHDVTIVTSTGNLDKEIDLQFGGDTLETLEQELPTVYLRRGSRILPATYYFAPALSDWLKANLHSFDIAIIHGTWTYFSWMGARACRNLGKPYLYFVHGSLDPWALNYHRLKKLPYWYLLEKPGFQKSAGVIVLSSDEATQVEEMGVNRPTILCRNGMLFPVPLTQDPEQILADSVPELVGHPFVCFMSRLHPKKGLEVLLNAWSTIHTRYPDWRLVIAGPDEGGYLNDLLLLARKLRIQASTLFAGLVTGETKIALLQSASVFTLPSFSEGVPGAVIEALAYGVPVLITPGCHLPEVREAQAGLIVAPNAASVAQGLDSMIQNSNVRDRMSINAAQLARNQFDEMKVASGLMEFCARISNKQSAGER